MKCYIVAFKRYADFSGRSRRKEFWFFKLFDWLVSVGLIFTGVALRPAVGTEIALVFMYLWIGYYLGAYIPTIAVAVRRLHDTGHSGWWIIVPFYNIYLLFKKGDEGYNEYGEEPIV
jgi:uncharacterized membrane protein YhaH (DUF805 family)